MGPLTGYSLRRFAMHSLVLTSLVGCSSSTDIDEDPTATTPPATATAPVDLDQDGAVAEVDCDDSDALIYPDATEVCDGIDNNCDLVIDEGFDVDSDGSLDLSACGDLGSDCNDEDPFIYVGASEVCDGVDNNCNDEVDESPTDGETYYADMDEDGFGDQNNTTVACEQPDNYLSNDEDCDDSTADISPIAAETCDLIDNNCNELIDDGVENTYYFDEDGDGYGDVDNTTEACEPPSSSYVSNGEDCDDSEFASNPGMSEICDGLDNNCDELVDPPNSAGATQYLDADDDGFGDPSQKGDSTCDNVEGYVHNNLDCNDSDSAYNPDAEEICGDGLDQNCDGEDLNCEN